MNIKIKLEEKRSVQITVPWRFYGAICRNKSFRVLGSIDLGYLQ
jgi:hypothetical protein